MRCPECGSDCSLEAIAYPSEKDPTYEFEFVCDAPYDEEERRACSTWFKVRTDKDFQPIGLVEVGRFIHGCQQHFKVPWDRVRKTRQSGRYKP